jgi:diguanylate cyclase (GGDEF)-like protein
VLITVALAAGFVLWSAGRTDERALERQRALAARMVETAKSDFMVTQTDQALRYEVVDLFLAGKPSAADIDSYFGADEYNTYGHDRVYVLDPDLNPIYAARDGLRTELTSYDADRAAIDPLAVTFGTPAQIAAIKTYQDSKSDLPPQAADVVALGGRAALVSVVPIVSNWDDQTQQPGHYYYHVAVSMLGSDAATDLMQQYMLDGVHFDSVPNTLRGETVVPIANNAGRFVAWLKWMPDLPGRALLAETLPASLGLIAVIAFIISLLLYGLARSTSALDKARAEALYRATHDPLTGLANRALFNERLERAALPLTLLALDLDRFKHVNDTLGHEAGDELLKQVAGRLTDLVRDTDLVARLGGDEFMILLSGRLDAQAAQELAARVVKCLAEPFLIGSDLAHIGVSVGIATAVTDERKDLVSRADFALYDAKESGRNTFRIFEERREAA